MSRDDLLWVALKVVGLYYAAQGLMAALNFAAMALASAGGPPLSMWLTSAVVPLAIGLYLLLDGGAILRLVIRGGREA